MLTALYENLFQFAESNGKIGAIGKSACGSLKNEIFFYSLLDTSRIIGFDKGRYKF